MFVNSGKQNYTTCMRSIYLASSFFAICILTQKSNRVAIKLKKKSFFVFFFCVFFFFLGGGDIILQIAIIHPSNRCLELALNAKGSLQCNCVLERNATIAKLPYYFDATFTYQMYYIKCLEILFYIMKIK